MEKVPFKSKHWLQIAPFLLCTQAIAEPVTSKADTDNDVIVMDTVDVDDTHEGSAEDGYRITNVSGGFAPIFPDTCYHLTHYWPAAADIPVASDNPVHYADAIRYNARTPLQGSLLPLTRLV